MPPTLLTELLAGLQLGEVGRNRQAAATTLVNGLNKLEFKPTNNAKVAVVTHLDFQIPKPRANARVISKIGSLTTASTTLAEVASWTVNTGLEGELLEVAIDSDNLAKTVWELSIAGSAKLGGATVRLPLTMPFKEVFVPPGRVVGLQARSSDGTSVVTYGAITGIEKYDHIFRCNIFRGSFITQQNLLITDDLVEHGLDLWIEIKSDAPLLLEATNINGLGQEPFAAVAHLFNTDEARLLTIRQMLQNIAGVTLGQRPVQEPPVTGNGAPQGGPINPQPRRGDDTRVRQPQVVDTRVRQPQVVDTRVRQPQVPDPRVR
jgi:hypothetical protein